MNNNERNCDVCGKAMNFAGERVESRAEGLVRRTREWNCSDKSCWTTDFYIEEFKPTAADTIEVPLKVS